MCVRKTGREPQAETNLLSFSLSWHLHCFRTPALKSDKYHTAPPVVFISREYAKAQQWEQELFFLLLMNLKDFFSSLLTVVPTLHLQLKSLEGTGTPGITSHYASGNYRVKGPDGQRQRAACEWAAKLFVGFSSPAPSLYPHPARFLTPPHLSLSNWDALRTRGLWENAQLFQNNDRTRSTIHRLTHTHKWSKKCHTETYITNLAGNNWDP